MLLSPLAVLLVAQIGLMLLGAALYFAFKTRRLLQELEAQKNTSLFQPELDASLLDGVFDAQPGPDLNLDQAERLLHRLQQGYADIVEDAPASQARCREQLTLLHALADCLELSLGGPALAKTAPPAAVLATASAATVAAAATSDDLITQEDIDAVLGQDQLDPELSMAIEGYDDDGLNDDGLDDQLHEDPALSDLDDLDLNLDDLDLDQLEAEAADLPADEPLVTDSNLPEDTLQAILDSQDDFDFSDLEQELLNSKR